MILFLKILAVFCCIIICYQDFKERAVFWFLFPLLGILLGALQFAQVSSPFFYTSIVTNAVLITLILVLLYLYARFVSKERFLDHSLGLGDILFFYALGIGFPPISFSLLFASSVLFSLLVYLILKKRLSMETVPLAGFMALYLIVVIGYSMWFNSPSLYII